MSNLAKYDISEKEQGNIIKKLNKAQLRLGNKKEFDKYFKTAYHSNANEEFITEQDRIFTESGVKTMLLEIPPVSSNSSKISALNDV